MLIRSRGSAPALAWCAECGARVTMLTPEEAAAIGQVTPRTIYRRVEAGLLHFNEGADGHLSICCASLR